MSSRSSLVAVLAVLLVAAAALAIVVVPAELVYRAKHGKWYHQERSGTHGGAGSAQDFRLYRAPFEVRKPPGRTRIVAVGGSTTYGFGLAPGEAWPARLAAKLEARTPGRYEVINLAYLGGHLEAFMADYVRASRRYVPREKWLAGERPAEDERAAWGWADLEPDIVIVVPVVNDTAPDYTFMRGRGHRGWADRADGLLERTPLVRALAVAHYLRVVLRKVPRDSAGFDAARAYDDIAESYRANLERFVALWGRERRVIVLGLPWLFNAGDGAREVELAMQVWNVSDRRELMDEIGYVPALEALERRVRREVASHGVAVAELGAELKARPFRERLRFYLDPVHVTAAGHDEFATEVLHLLTR